MAEREERVEGLLKRVLTEFELVNSENEIRRGDPERISPEMERQMEEGNEACADVVLDEMLLQIERKDVEECLESAEEDRRREAHRWLHDIASLIVRSGVEAAAGKHAEEQMSRCEHELRSKENELNDLQSELDDVRAEVEELRTERDGLWRQVEDHKRYIFDLEKRREETTREISELETRVEEGNREISELQTRVEETEEIASEELVNRLMETTVHEVELEEKRRALDLVKRDLEATTEMLQDAERCVSAHVADSALASVKWDEQRKSERTRLTLRLREMQLRAVEMGFSMRLMYEHEVQNNEYWRQEYQRSPSLSPAPPSPSSSPSSSSPMGPPRRSRTAHVARSQTRRPLSPYLQRQLEYGN